MSAVRIPAEERLTNLVVALMATEIGLTRQQIVDTVSGYRQRTEAGATSESLERMFERDKEELRALGVPVQTLGDPSDPKNLREARYRIPQAEYDLPDDILFTPVELAVLQLAGSVWGAGSQSAEAVAGVRKIRALGIDGDEPIIGFAPRVVVRDAAFGPLQDAIETCAEVGFDYLKPGDGEARRRVLRPLSLVEYEGRWHVYGEDVRAGGDRTFLLSRIVGAVTRTGETFDAELRDGAGERALEGLRAVAEKTVAVVAVQPGTETALRLARRARASAPAAGGESAAAGALELHIPYVDVHVLADELAAAGPEVRVIAPESLRGQVIARLRAVVDRHGDPAAPERAR